MKKQITLDDITNGLLTIQKLKQLNSRESLPDGTDAKSFVYPDKLSLLKETLTSISNFLPETRGFSLNDALRISSRYSSTYRGIKHQVRDMKRGHIDTTQIIASLKMIVPLLENRQKIYMDKAVKIAEIVTS
jgi:hypothetical protein